jgi:hypothetical protein
MSLRLSLLACLACALPMTASTIADAADRPITIAAVAEPPAVAGIDGNALRSAAEEQIRTLDGSHIARPVAISLAVVGATNTPASCTVNATVLDRRTGAMLGIAAGYAYAPDGATGDPRPTVARTALRNAVARIPDIISAAGASKK